MLRNGPPYAGVASGGIDQEERQNGLVSPPRPPQKVPLCHLGGRKVHLAALSISEVYSFSFVVARPTDSLLIIIEAAGQNGAVINQEPAVWGQIRFLIVRIDWPSDLGVVTNSAADNTMSADSLMFIDSAPTGPIPEWPRYTGHTCN